MEGDAGTSRLNPTDTDDSTDETDEVVSEAPADSPPEATETSDGRPSRLTRGWFVGVVAALVVLAVGAATGGFFALRAHNQDAASARAEEEAVAAAKDCVAATNAPNPETMAASVQKIIDCSTGDFGTQAKLMAPMMVEAYKAANSVVEVTDMRAAAERHNDDGSIDVLVAFRFRVPTNPDTQSAEIGVRLRAQMKSEDGRYKIAALDQVMS
jgi:Mce-associated membrane protein